MKSTIVLFILSSILRISAQDQSVGGSSSSATNSVDATNVTGSAYAVTERGPHHRVWQRVVTTTNLAGEAVNATNSYTEIATGTNATLTVTNGAAIACYNDAGIWIQDGGSIVSIGTPLAPNWFTRYSSVQEMPVYIGAALPLGVMTMLIRKRVCRKL